VTVHAKDSSWDIAFAKPAGTHITNQHMWWSEAVGGCAIELSLEHAKHTDVLTLANGAPPEVLMVKETSKRPQHVGSRPPTAEVTSADDVRCHGEFDVAFTPDDGAVPAPDPKLLELAGAYTTAITWSVTEGQVPSDCGITLPTRLAFHVNLDSREGNELRIDDLDLLELFGDTAYNESISSENQVLKVEQEYIYAGANQGVNSSAELWLKGSDGAVTLTRIARTKNGTETRCELFGRLHREAPQ